jgi:multicomponent Na+:H+ antiporter subunit E
MLSKLVIRLALTLLALWFLLSGMFKTQLIILGFLSIALVTWLSVRMQILKHRGQPVFFKFLAILGYWGWLLLEILRSNWAVLKVVFNPSMPIKPMLKRVEAAPDTEIGLVIYANSITLTPGTTSINFTESGDILVHALHEDSIHELELGSMADQVRKVEPHIALSGAQRANAGD